MRCGIPTEPTALGQPSVRLRISTRSDPPSQNSGNGRRPDVVQIGWGRVEAPTEGAPTDMSRDVGRESGG